MKKCWTSKGQGIAWEPDTHRLHLCVWGIRKSMLAEPDLPERIRAELPTEAGAVKCVLMSYRNATEDMHLSVNEVCICFKDHSQEVDK